MTPTSAPRFHLTVHQLHDGKTTQVIDAYGNGFITAIATLDGEYMDVHFGEGGPRRLQQHIADAIADEHGTGRTR
ncbi:MAG: hypothetical protein ACSLFR_03850 [Solirubrobacteraceae bacterium]